MIKPVRGWLDSDGTLHLTREDASKAEFRKLLAAHFAPCGRFPIEAPSAIPVDELVAAMFKIDKMIGQAVMEDSRADIG